MSALRLGIDIGGTFTDVVLLDERTGEVLIEKVLSTPHDPSEGVVVGIRRLIKRQDLEGQSIGFFVYGSTVALNALLERKGCKAALLTTAGFEDILEIGRQTRQDLFDPMVERAPVLVPRSLRRGIRERVSATGEVVKPLDVEQAKSVLQEFQTEEIEALAICFLHAYARPEHERRVKELAEELLPEVFVTASSEVCPQFREYERMSTTVITAYLGPIFHRALERLGMRVGECEVNDLKIMQSNIGIAPPKTVEREPARTLLSGPCGGVAGSIYFGKIVGFRDLITLDMGGTSTDVCLVHEGEPSITTEGAIDTLPIMYPMVDIVTIGAGGGSIATIDEIGNLHVGPRSAGSVPGPVCYRRGGTSPTITDAHLIMGHLGADSIFKDRALDSEGAKRAIEEQIAKPLKMDLEAAAAGILRVANSNMGKAIRLVSVERGFDLKAFTLLAFGGVGPMHAMDLALEVGIPRVLVPPFAGVYSALGLLTVDLKTDFACFHKRIIEHPSPMSPEELLEEAYAGLLQRAEDWFALAQVPQETRRIRRSLDMRYRHQNYELIIPIDGMQSVDEVIDAFHARHRLRYGHMMVGEPVEIVSLRVEAIGSVRKLPLEERSAVAGDVLQAIRTERQVWISGENALIHCPIYDWARLFPGAKLGGPAIIEQSQATIVIPRGGEACIDGFGNLLITIAR